MLHAVIYMICFVTPNDWIVRMLAPSFAERLTIPNPFAHAKAMAKAAKAETAWYFQAISRKKETHNYFYLDIFWSTGTSIMTVDGQVQ